MGKSGGCESTRWNRILFVVGFGKNCPPREDSIREEASRQHSLVEDFHFWCTCSYRVSEVGRRNPVVGMGGDTVMLQELV